MLVAIGAFSLFLYIKGIVTGGGVLTKVVCIISKNSLAIYGLHPLCLDFLKNEGYRNFNRPILDIPIAFLFVFILVLIISMALKNIDKYNTVT